MTLRSGDREYAESFDLVVGADGLRSTTRRLAFGPDKKYMKPLHTMICAFQLPEPLPLVAAGESAVLAQRGRSLWLFGLSDTAPTLLLTYRTRKTDEQFVRPVAVTLRDVYRDFSGGGLVEHALAGFEHADQYLFDSVQQVKMRRWHKGRVVLVGDAAWCLTLYSGMGATAGLLGGAVLGEALIEHGDDVDQALGAFEARLRPFVKKHQFIAHLKGQIFVPSNDLIAKLRILLLRKGARRLGVDGTIPALADVRA